EELTGAAAWIGRHPRQRYDVAPVLPGGDGCLEVVRRARRRNGTRQRGEAARELARGGIGPGIQNPTLAARGGRRTRGPAGGTRPQIEPPEAAFRVAGFGAHGLLETVESRAAGLGRDVHVRAVPRERDHDAVFERRGVVAQRAIPRDEQIDARIEQIAGIATGGDTKHEGVAPPVLRADFLGGRRGARGPERAGADGPARVGRRLHDREARIRQYERHLVGLLRQRDGHNLRLERPKRVARTPAYEHDVLRRDG